MLDKMIPTSWQNYQKGEKKLKNKWVFKLKNDDEKLLKYKARLLVKGFGRNLSTCCENVFKSSYTRIGS